MAIRLITKATGRILAKTHCNMFYMGKGNNLYGNPYGIIPTEDEDPLGLVFSESTLTVSVKPGQVYCYGRQCIIDEETQILDMHDWKRTEKCYGVVYLQIDLSDIVEQFCRFDLAYGTENYPDFNQNMNHSNLYKRGNGIYDVPIARFIYSPDGEGGKHFINYMKVIPLLDEQARAVSTNIEKIGGMKIEDAFKNSLSLIKANSADHCESAHTIGDTIIGSHLEKVWTGKRVQFGSYKDTDFIEGTTKNIPVKIDRNHLQRMYIVGKSFVSSDPRRDTYIRFPAQIDRSWFKKENIDILIKLSFSELMFNKEDNIEVQELTIGVPLTEVFNKKTNPVFLDIVIFKQSTLEYYKHIAPLAKITVTNNGIAWNGLFPGTFHYYSSDSTLSITLDSPSIVGSTKDGKWFYGNQGNGIYADFLYKGDVNVS